MNELIYNPLEEYENKFKHFHLENTNKFFDELVKQSGVDIEANRETVKEYLTYTGNLQKLRQKLSWFKFLRVLMYITLLLIPLVIWWFTPKIKKLKEEVDSAENKAAELLELAYDQMNPLNSLFTSKDCLTLIEQTIPLLSFDENFSMKQEMDMLTNFDFDELRDTQQSTLDTLAGHYNENPFLFESKLIHTLGTETYHGSKVISWTETYTDGDGKLRTRTQSQTLHATVVKPKPFYSTQVYLDYGAQGAPELLFDRVDTHLENMNDKQIERYINKGEKKLKKMTDKAISQNKDFMSMSNSDFEVLFGALNRTNEVQFRTLFTPLAQTNMVSLILSKENFGDDFRFLKRKRMNQIITNHSQGRNLKIPENSYASYSFDIIKENFISQNAAFFKAVYFDFAPIWSIPMYQERPVQSLKPLPDYKQLYSQKECEVLSNMLDAKYVVHPDTKTEAILKTSYISSTGNVDETCITAYSYDIFPRVEYVSVYGGDGRYHSVAVPWDEYIPLESSNHFYISTLDASPKNNIIASKNGLCIFQ